MRHIFLKRLLLSVFIKLELIVCRMHIDFIVLVYFSVNLFSHFFVTFRKKDPRPKWTLYKHKSDKNKKYCLSIVLAF